ncbi:MAG: aldolase/citrate lyase family protein [Planctomycetota bacterium]|nr:aldolase/citrate lyase family protein [Planctomycetota bacterium]MDA1211838.1 aldolase/citrate lyase family protein [Planctomycetota bacterium]
MMNIDVRPNPVKEKLQNGQTVFSSSLRLPEPGICEVLGYAGWDFVLLDGEHGALDHTTIDRMVQSCFASGTVPMVRVPKNDDPESVMLALDLGVQGVLIPHCRTADDARRLKEAAFYAPEGKRGFGPGRGTMWGRIPLDRYFERINDSIVLLALVEDIEALDNIDEIAAAGLDVLWVGTGDLAMAYGVPGQRNHPLVQEAADKILAACQKHGVCAGYPAKDAQDALWAVEKGYRAVGFGCAEQYIMQQSRQFLETVSSAKS